MAVFREYVWHGRTFQFREGKAPADAVLKDDLKDKQRNTRNKARTPRNKAA